MTGLSRNNVGRHFLSDKEDSSSSDVMGQRTSGGEVLRKRDLLPRIMTDSEMKTKTDQLRSSQSVTTIQEEIAGKEQESSRRYGRYGLSRKSGRDGSVHFKSSAAEEWTQPKSPLGALDDLKSREVRTRRFQADSFYEELMKTSQPRRNHDFHGSRRAILRDISPPGMWPVSADQDEEFTLRRRALLEASETGAVTGD
ncbi:hypothetical protein R1flu_026592 [Riccia fluitans]|uniref:Uncharacterized protein n=1 Tax=Riccia fluitans TaxID=41844 RepID=A0ABD1XGD0_9MARC